MAKSKAGDLAKEAAWRRRLARQGDRGQTARAWWRRHRLKEGCFPDVGIVRPTVRRHPLALSSGSAWVHLGSFFSGNRRFGGARAVFWVCFAEITREFALAKRGECGMVNAECGRKTPGRRACRRHGSGGWGRGSFTAEDAEIAEELSICGRHRPDKMRANGAQPDEVGRRGSKAKFVRGRLSISSSQPKFGSVWKNVGQSSVFRSQLLVLSHQSSVVVQWLPEDHIACA